MASAPTPAHAAHHLHTTAGTSRTTLEKTTQRCTSRGPAAVAAYRHYFYFANEDDARSAAAELEAFETTVQAPGDGIDEWAVLAEQTIALDESALNDLTQLLDEVARRLHGEYDGWDVATKI